MKFTYKRTIKVDDSDITAGGQLTLKQSLVPNFLVTILFFLWGFAYGLLDVLNSHFQSELNITASDASGLSAAYFGAYFLAPLTFAGWTLRKYGFRATFMTGLSILAVGCLLFWPSGVKKSFGGFCGSMFVVGAGLGTLETGADNFLSICGPPRYSEIRLNLAQAVQGIGSFVAPLLASRVFFANTVDNAQGLKNVQWVYLAIACFVALLIIFFYLAPLVEVTDMDMHTLDVFIGSEEFGDSAINSGDLPLYKQYNLFLGCWSQFCYVGAQVCVANYFINFAEEAGYSRAASSNLLATAQGCFAFMRFVSGFALMHPRVKPRILLMSFLSLCFLFSLLATVLSGKASVAMLILVLSFESTCFPTIFALALRGLGRHTKTGGSFIVASICGGAVFPPMSGAIATNTGSFHKSMAIPTAAYVASMIFPIYVNTVGKQRADAHRNTKLNVDVPALDNKADLMEKAEAETENLEVVETVH